MATKNLILLGVIGLAAYLLFSKKSTLEAGVFPLSPTSSFNVSQGSAGQPYYSPAVVPNLKVATPAKVLSTGTETFNNINGKSITSKITVTSPARNAAGQTATDLLISSNLKASAANVAKGLTFKGYGGDNKAIWV